MPGKHEPHDAFIDRLEWQIRAEARRRHRSAQAPGWLPQSRLAAALSAVALVLVSMAVGGGVVAAAYQARQNVQRDLLLSAYERRAELAMERVSTAKAQLQTAEERVSVGVAPRDAILEARFKVAEAEAQLQSIRLQIDEIRITGREPLDEVSSPLVSGRDFVTKRWLSDLSVPQAALELGKTRMRDAERRFAVGLAQAIDVEVSRTRVIELEAAVVALRRKIGIRQSFLKGELDATLADLRVLEVEADQRRTALEPKIALARKQLSDLQLKVEMGTAQPIEVAEARLRLQELELEMSKAEVDLAVIRRRIGR